MRCIVSTVVAVVVATAATQTAGEKPVVDRAAAYAVEFSARLTNIVAEERYVQELTSPHRRRELKSGAGVRLVQFFEWARPTVLRRAAANADLPARGRLWVEERTGRVVRTELRAAEAAIVTTFEVDSNLESAVPVEMRDRYTYKNFDVTGVRDVRTVQAVRRAHRGNAQVSNADDRGTA